MRRAAQINQTVRAGFPGVRRSSSAAVAPAAIVSAPAPRVGLASQRELVWQKFREHRLAYFSLLLVVAIYLVGGFCELVAPRTPDYYYARYTLVQPQTLICLSRRRGFAACRAARIRIFIQTRSADAAADFRAGRGGASSRRVVRGRRGAYYLWGLIPLRTHLIGPDDPTAARSICWAPTGSAGTCSAG